MRKGFTLVELLVTIIILGLLTTVVYMSASTILKRGNENYYKTQEDMLLLAGREYFADYRSKLPKEIRGVTSVTLQTLIEEKYIEPIKDDKEESCNNTQSNVSAQKISESEYQYRAVLVCDSYKSEKDNMKPVITFSPNEKSSKDAIRVTMKITDNKEVDKYRYVITKDDESYREENFRAYTNDETITLSDKGIYQITGYAIDKAGNIASKKSGTYSIYDTIDCNKVKFNSSVQSNKWTNKNININVDVPSNTAKWELNYKVNNGNYVITNTYLGNVSQTINLSEEGIHQYKVTVYDSYGNSCSSSESGPYKIDKTRPSNIGIKGNPGCVTQPRTISPILSAVENGSGIAKWQWGYSTNAMNDYANSASNTFTSTPFSAARNQLVYFRAQDNAGNWSAFASTNICIQAADPDKNFAISCANTCSGNCSLQGYNNDRIWTWWFSGIGSGIKSREILYSTKWVTNYCTYNDSNLPYGSRRKCGYAHFTGSTLMYSRSYAKSNIVGRVCTNRNKCKSCVLYN